MDAELIAEHAGGIIITTGCPSGCRPACGSVGSGGARSRGGSGGRVVGPDSYFPWLMDHGLTISRVRDGLLEIGRALNIPPLAAMTAVTRDAAHNHEALLCADRQDHSRIRIASSSTVTATTGRRNAPDLGRRSAGRVTPP